MNIEKKTEVKVFQIELICDCGGSIESTDVMQPTYPPKYHHRCDKCEKEQWLKKIYPRIDYKEIK